MKPLIKQLKPHWLIIALIMVTHFIQAYTTLLLPDYTSHLIDAGIQNGGFEQPVAVSLSKEAYQQLIEDTDDESSVSSVYSLQGDHYVLNEDVAHDEARLIELGQHWQRPLATAYLRLQAMNRTLSSDAIAQQLDAMGDTAVKNIAMQFVKAQYQATGGDIHAHQMAYLMSEGAKMLGVSFIMVIAAFFGHYLSARVGAKVGHDLRLRTFGRVLQFSQTEINKFSTASLMTRSTNDIQQVQNILIIILRISLYAPILALGGIFHVIESKSGMTWIVVLAVALVLSVVSILFSLTIPKFKLLQQQVDKVNLFAREILTGLQVVRAYGRQEEEAKRFDKASMALRDTHLFTNRVMSLMMPSMTLIMNGTAALIVWIASHRIAEGLLQVGQMTAFINYTMQIIFSFLMMTMMAVMMPRAMVAAERIQEVIDEPLTIQDVASPTVLTQQRGEVAFHNVSFQYDNAELPTLQGISFVAKSGQTTALIGSTGSGKSTVLNLLMRFYDVTEGSITIDGVDIRQLSQHQLRDMIGYVPQKGVLFSGTIASNIAYGNASLSQEEMEHAARIAHADTFIADKPNTYESDIAQGGSNVSGGQKQRLSIARALAKKPHIMLFDDSFSALDYKTDASLRQALHDNLAEATVLIVAQRISTIINADQIIVLDEGKIADIGTHSQLMAQSKVYREIAESQLSATELATYDIHGKEEA